MMIRLPNTVSAWQTPSFNAVFISEFEKLNGSDLPLQECLRQSSYRSDSSLSVMIISSEENDTSIKVKIGVFFSGIIAGCSCADDPTPESEINEYCELTVLIDKQTAEAVVSLTS